jgi:hypothetical protein
MKVLVLFACAAALSVPSFAAKRKKFAPVRAESLKPKAPEAPIAKPTAPAAPVAPPAPSLPRDEAILSAFGAVLSDGDDELVCSAPRPGSAADATGLREGDSLWRLNASSPRSRSDAAASRRGEGFEMRDSAVVRRGLAALALTGPEAAAPESFTRAPGELSAREKALAFSRYGVASDRARDAVAETPALDWTLRADQAFWIRFPAGLPADLRRDDVIEAESSTGLTTDGSLDFLAVPPKSKVWARVVSFSDDGVVRVVKLVIFKLRLSGGHYYPLFAVPTAVAGVTASELTRVSGPGSLVIAVPLPSPEGSKKKSGPELLLDGEARLRVRLVDPVVVSEAPSYWRAGPGLWLKTTDKDGRRRFQVTHVVAGRSAAKAGLVVGDILDSVAGRSSERMDFDEALDNLYGAPGTTVKVSVQRPNGSATLELTRVAKPLPFEAR